MRRYFVITLHAFAGWSLCALTIAAGFALTNERTALIIHAIAAPLIFGALSWFYFRTFHYTSPFITALVFLGFTMAVDFFLVALVIQNSLAMFSSILGTWLPFGLIFVSTYSVGRHVTQGA